MTGVCGGIVLLITVALTLASCGTQSCGGGPRVICYDNCGICP